MPDAARTVRRVLLIGAHLDGQWVDMSGNAISYRVPQPMELQLLADPDPVQVPLPEFVDYRLERFPIAIRSARADVWIGVVAELRGQERDLAIVRALFQRDVAQLFRESR
jgi:hypothetical protein